MTHTQLITPPNGVRRNQRRTRRQPPKSSTRARAYKNALGLGTNIAAGVLDVSEAGARLLLKEELPVGHEFEVILESPGSRSVKVLARVVWSVPAADGTFVVGTVFQARLSYPDLHALARV
jgi:hypothetical protein